MTKHAVAVNEPWYPAGPAMDTLTYSIFADDLAEFNALQSPSHQIDFTDWPLSPNLIAPFTTDPSLLVTQAISDAGYFELQFNQGNNFWNCKFNYGNPVAQGAPLTTSCGLNIRQAFAHGLDKNQFSTTELQGLAVPIDNPVPPSIDLNTPDPCAWDPLFPQTGSGCIVNGPGGTAYHLATAASCGIATCPSLPSFAYTPGMGTPDFCAAADHLIAAGLATGKNGGPGTGTCVLTGVQLSTITANPVEIFGRNDNVPSYHAGQSLSQFICALFTGAFSTGCGVSPSTINIVHFNPGPITAFAGFTTPIGSTSNLWWVYTAGFGNILTFDASLFYSYESQFVSGYSAIEVSAGGNCSNAALPSFAPGNYMYICNGSYDSFATQAESAPCLTASGDPSTGQTRLTVTFANCPGTTPAALSSASAAYKAQDIFGQNAYTIPLWSGQNQFGYLNGWQRAVVHKGDGFTPYGNFFTTLDARNSAPPVAGAIRQGYKQTTGSVNPFIGGTVWDQGVIGSIYDKPGSADPSVPSSYMDWMTKSTAQIPALSLGYTPPGGACIGNMAGNPPGCTVAAFRYDLRLDMFWQFASTTTPGVPGSLGASVTAWDIAFSYIAYKSNGVAPGLATMTGVHIVSASQVDILVNSVGPFTKLFLSNPIIPGRSWTGTCPGTQSTAAANWDAYVNQGRASSTLAQFHVADNSITPCIAPAGSVTVLPGGGNIILPTGSSVDTAKVLPSYDVAASNNLIGSGPWVCKSTGTIGGGCSSSNNSSPPIGGSWTFARYGQGFAPGATLDSYFRSNGNLALWIWSQDTGDFSHDSTLFSILASCVNLTPVPAKCNGWTQGIGNGSGTSASPATIGVTQASIVLRFVGVNWVSPYDWRTLPPQNIGAFPPVLYEGSATLNPAPVAGCTISYSSGGGYDC